MANGNKLAAVKLYKDVTGLGPAESKDYVDQLNERRDVPAPDPSASANWSSSSKIRDAQIDDLCIVTQLLFKINVVSPLDKTDVMKIQNPHNKPLQEILFSLSAKYPGSEIKKPFLSPITILAPQENFKFLVRDRKTFLKIDFIPPVIWVIGAVILSFILVSIILSVINGQFVFGIGGALWIVLGLLIVKYIFKSMNKQKFETFYADVQSAVNKDDSTSIF